MPGTTLEDIDYSDIEEKFVKILIVTYRKITNKCL